MVKPHHILINTGIVCFLLLVVGGFLVYQYPNQLQNLANKADNYTQNQVTSQIKIIKDIRESDPQNKSIPKVVTPQPVTTPQTYTLEELRQIDLDAINQDRATLGLTPLKLINSTDSQIFAEQLLAEGCIAHRSSGRLAENVAGESGYDDVISAIQELEHGMFYNDAEEHQGHRQNIIWGGFGQVSIGVAYNENYVIIVNDFGYSAPGFTEMPNTKTCL